MHVDFDFNYHGDLCASIGGSEPHNFGYNSLLHIPLLFYLASLQLGRGNLFQHVTCPEVLGSLDHESAEIVTSARALARQLPLETSTFNLNIDFDGFSRMSNGSFSVHYQALLEPSSENASELHLRYYRWERGEDKPSQPTFALSPDDFLPFTSRYVDFILHSPRVPRYRKQLPLAICSLR